MSATSKSVKAAVLGTLILASSLAAQGGGGGGGGGNQAPPENLQVLPKDMPRAQVTNVMRSFTGALGVNCAFCHAEREGAPAANPNAAPAGGGPGGGGGGPPLNYALDNKDQKKTARLMLKMVDSINNVYLKMMPTRDASAPVPVNCYTCHRGVSKPMTIDMVLAQTIEKNGVDSAIARYRALRTDVAAGRYNFTETPVTQAAQRLAASGKHDDALKLLQMNFEFNPTSANVDYEIADVLVAKRDSAAGIARLRSILQKNPQDRRARARLTALGVTP
jgi:hypothetical protein